MSWVKSEWSSVKAWASTLKISFVHLAVCLHLLVFVILIVLWSPSNVMGDQGLFENEVDGSCGAKEDLAAFLVIQTAELVATPPRNTNDATEHAFTCDDRTGRVLLHPVGKGTEVSTDDVGPRYEQNGAAIVTIRVVAPLTTVSAGDVIDLLIEPAPEATPAENMSLQRTTAPRRIAGATVLVVGEASDDGLLPVVVAVPPQRSSNQEVVEQIERGSIFTVVYAIPSTPAP